jgi:voltage-gated sodium channel
VRLPPLDLRVEDATERLVDVRPIFRHLINERLVMTVILVNTMTIFLRSFEWWRAHTESLLFAIDYACTLYFVVEIGLKLRSAGVRAYFSTGWNVVDFIVVLCGVPLLIAPVIEIQDTSFILVLRVARVMRSFRVLRFVPDAERLWSGVRRGVKASLGVLFALGIYNFVLALCASHLFGDVAPNEFGDPLIALYSMFKVITVEGWYEVPDAIAAGSSPFIGFAARIFFMFAVATGGVLGLSMANAVFIDEMVMDNTRDLEQNVRDLLDEVRALRLQQEHQETLLTDAITAFAGKERSGGGEQS